MKKSKDYIALVSEKKGNYMEAKWSAVIEKLKGGRLQLSQEDEELIIAISEKL